MSETQTAAPKLPQIMPAGGQVTAVVPQSIEEIFRVSRGVVQSGLAPYALTGKTETEADVTRATSAVAIVIMAGAELGLPPMVALRSFTAINGRPALYGDGLINVVRRSKMAKRINVGFTPTEGPDPYGEAATGFCEAERLDTGETKRVEFSVRQAKRAGLWQPDDMIWKDVWSGPKGNRTSKREQVPNDSPWYRYPERMLGWRAAGFCLRELFGDVLGGITDDWEAREISGMVDISPQQQAPTKPATLPEVPADEPQPTPPSDAKASGVGAGASGPAGTNVNNPARSGGDTADDFNNDDSGVTIEGEAKPTAFVPTGVIGEAEDKSLKDLTFTLDGCKSEAQIEEAFDAFNPQEVFAGNGVAIAKAFEIKAAAIHALATKQHADIEAAGQGNMFDLPEVPPDDDLPLATRLAGTP